MTIIGIDPGTTRIGFGVISEQGGKLNLIDYGIIEGRAKQQISVCILENCQKLSKIIKKYKPKVAGIEKIFFAKNIKTGIDVAQSRGALILELAKAGIKIKELSPSEIKSSVTGYGLADKKSVSKVAAMILGIKDGLKGYDDASDAVAIAIATAFSKEFGE